MAENETLDSICYTKNFLTEVIARVDLVSQLPDTELPKDLSQAALKYFPIYEPKQAFHQTIRLDNKGEFTTQRKEFTEHNFYGREREKYLRITPKAFFISYEKYEKYEILRQDFLFITESFFKHFSQAQPSRIGLRYINQLVDLPEAGPLDWQIYVNKNLLGLFSYNIEGTIPSRIFHDFEVLIDNFSLHFQFGVYNQDYPAPIKRKAFILDYDAYFQGLLEPTDIPDCLDQYHKAIQKVFEQNITDKLREIMK